MTGMDGKHSNVIHSVAVAGQELSASLLKFASKWDSSGIYITDIAVTVSTIATLLLDTTNTIEKHGEEWAKEYGIDIVCEGIKLDFETIAQVVTKAELKAGPGRFVVRPRKHFMATRNSSLVEDSSNDGPDQSFLNKLERLDDKKDELWYLYEGFRYLTLRRLQKKSRLESDEAQELERLLEQLPTITTELAFLKKSIIKGAKQGRAAEQKREQVNGTNPVEEPQWKRDIRDSRRNVFDDDVRSIYSTDSLASFKFLGIDEVYEAWFVRRIEGEEWPRRSWGIGWLRIYEYFNGGGYEFEPQAMTIEKMKEKSETVRSGEFRPGQSELIEQKLAAVPEGVQRQINIVVEDQARISTNPRYTRNWKIVDIINTAPKVNPTPVWMLPFRGQPAFSEALFIIKGETAKSGDASKPQRDQDPFMKPQFRSFRGNRVYPREVIVGRGPRSGLPRRKSFERIVEPVKDPSKTFDPQEAET